MTIFTASSNKNIRLRFFRLEGDYAYSSKKSISFSNFYIQLLDVIEIIMCNFISIENIIVKKEKTHC